MSIQEDDTDAGNGEGKDGFGAEFARLGEEEAELANSPSGASDKPDGDQGAADQSRQEGEPSPGDAAPPAKEPAGEIPDDPWAKAPPELKTAYEAEKTAREQAESTARSQARAASQAGRRLAELERRLPKTDDQPAASEETDAQRAERYAKLKEDFPELASVIDDAAQTREELKGIKAAQASVEDERTESFLREQYGHLEKKHPTWRQDVLDPRFATWKDAQPRFVQDAIERNAATVVDGVETAEVLRLYKQSINAADPGAQRHQERRREQLDGNRAPTVKAPAATSQGANDFDAEFKRLGQEEARRAPAGRGRR
jgi:hypothetical protein